MKLTKEELLKQLKDIEKEEQVVKNNIFYETYSELTFFQILKKIHDWKMIFIICFLIELLLIFSKQSVWLLLILPISFLLVTINNTYDIIYRIKHIKKNK